jgi:ribosome maturation factor RimP
MLDVSLGDDYILEVSSPGVDRKFFNIEQLNDYLGEELEFKTKELIDGKRKFNGILSECDENYFYVKQNNKDKNIIKFKFNDLDLCKLKPNYNKLIKEYSNAK